MTKILLVEDDKSLREIYGVRLYAEGYDIVSAGDGEEALAMAIKEKPALIVSDVMMPKISGFDMLDILRSTTETRDIKVIMMTALSSEDQRQRGEQLGADRYLVKSQVGIEDVVRTVHDVLGDAPAPAAAASPFGGPQVSAAQQPQQMQQPQQVAPSAPQQQPQQQQQVPQLQRPVTAPQTPTQDSALPRPTAPFSSQRPANLGDRVIHPLTTDESGPRDVSSLIDQELSGGAAGVQAPILTPPASPAIESPMPQPTQPEQHTDTQSTTPSLTPPPDRATMPQPPRPPMPPLPPRDNPQAFGSGPSQ